MAQRFGVIPDGLTGVADFVGDVGSAEQALAAQMGAAPAGYSAHVHGDMADHWAHWGGVLDALGAQAAWLKSHADLLGQAARIFHASDEV